jgi:hypothetical protein
MRNNPAGGDDVMLKWLLRGFAGAVVGGLGWKLGADAYEEIKKRLRKQKEEPKPDEENGAGPAQMSTPETKGEPTPNAPGAR